MRKQRNSKKIFDSCSQTFHARLLYLNFVDRADVGMIQGGSFGFALKQFAPARLKFLEIS
jgi:hypothetical protein